MGSTMEVGKKLVALCQEGKFMEAMESLYGPGIVSIEGAIRPGDAGADRWVCGGEGKGGMVGEEPHCAQREGGRPLAAWGAIHRALHHGCDREVRADGGQADDDG